jgi:hypothetical protein
LLCWERKSAIRHRSEARLRVVRRLELAQEFIRSFGIVHFVDHQFDLSFIYSIGEGSRRLVGESEEGNEEGEGEISNNLFEIVVP